MSIATSCPTASVTRNLEDLLTSPWTLGSIGWGARRLALSCRVGRKSSCRWQYGRSNTSRVRTTATDTFIALLPPEKWCDPLHRIGGHAGRQDRLGKHWGHWWFCQCNICTLPWSWLPCFGVGLLLTNSRNTYYTPRVSPRKTVERVLARFVVQWGVQPRGWGDRWGRLDRRREDHREGGSEQLRWRGD